MTKNILFFLALFLTILTLCDSFLVQTSVRNNVRMQNSLKMTSTESSVEVQLGRVTMYKKEGCPYCKLAIELLEGKYGMTVTYVDIEVAETRDDVLQQMRTFTGGRNTVPQIFFNSDHIGGNDDLQKLELEGNLSGKIVNVRKEEVGRMQDNWFHPWY